MTYTINKVFIDTAVVPILDWRLIEIGDTDGDTQISNK